MLKQIVLLLFITTLAACSTGSSSNNPTQKALVGTPIQAANTVVQSLHKMQYSSAGLAAFTDFFDSAGVRFSPYYYIENKYLVLTGEQVKSDWITQNPPVRMWGEQDGSGQPIKLTTRDYFSNFVWNFPYHNKAKITLINSKSDFLSSGNTLNNMLTFYPLPQYRIVEYHQAGVDPKVVGMDWSSLMVVLEDLGNNKWSLVGLVHGSWTI